MCVMVGMMGVGTNAHYHRSTQLFQQLQALYRITNGMHAQGMPSRCIVPEGYDRVKHSQALVKKSYAQ